MDARTDMVVGSTGRTGEILQPPLLGFLARCHAEIAGDHSGAVADYIPELTKADANDFGISIATTDGYVYEVGDSDVPFTIQSISKAFVFALALETIGAEKVESLIGVEPSGDVFNSIRLRRQSPLIRWSNSPPRWFSTK
jgi:glutaminase